MVNQRTVSFLWVSLRIAIILSLANSVFFSPVGQAKASPADTGWYQEILGPDGSKSFGDEVEVLPNGNIVVVDRTATIGGVNYAGAVSLYDGDTLTRISRLTGSQSFDLEYAAVLVLENGNFLVITHAWHNGSAPYAGAVTYCSATLGCEGPISAENSLVGTQNSDLVGGISLLENGWYAVISDEWDNGAIKQAGAVTFCDGEIGCVGPVTEENSLVGVDPDGQVGLGGVQAVSRDAYVVLSPGIDDSTTGKRGALTYCPSLADCHGRVSVSNSLIGISFRHYTPQVSPLGNGAYVVSDPDSFILGQSGAGIVMYCPAGIGCTGESSPENGLVGSSHEDHVGDFVQVLPSGNYIVFSPEWDHGTVPNVGAVTWCSGVTGCTGVVSEENSLIGSSAEDMVGYNSFLFYKDYLLKDDYLVVSHGWDDQGKANVGAVTWCSGETGCAGEISPENSLVGSSSDDGLLLRVVSHPDAKNYLVRFPHWDGPGAVDAGAVTWCPVEGGCTGLISAEHSLVGSHPGDRVGYLGAIEPEGTLLASAWWSGTAKNAGAVTICNQLAGCPGVVSEENSLVGSQAWDRVGNFWIREAAGSLVIFNPEWKNSTGAVVGAVSHCRITQPCVGRVGPENSLVGTAAGDLGITVEAGELVTTVKIAMSPEGDYVVNAPSWDNGSLADTGASIRCSSQSGCTGEISATNSLIGSQAGEAVGSIAPLFLRNGQYVVVSANTRVQNRSGTISICSQGTCLGEITLENSLIVGNGTNFGTDDYHLVSSLEDGSLVIEWFWPSMLVWCVRSSDCLGFLWQNPRRIENINGYGEQNFLYNPGRDQLLVGIPDENRVVLVSRPTVMLGIQQPDNQILVGQSFKIYATAESPMGTPTGNMEFTVDGGPPITVPLTGGTADLQITHSQAGAHTILVKYIGSGVYSGIVRDGKMIEQEVEQPLFLPALIRQ